MQTDVVHALNRFGLGRRGQEPLPSDPAAWLKSQLRRPDIPRIDPFPSSASGLAALRQDRDTKEKGRESAARQLFATQSAGELEHALTTDMPFRERLVWFWTNHFAISLRRGDVAGVACAFIEEAIRPYVAGSFTDMVLAVMRHPAMQLYLDNARSIGPNSVAEIGRAHV